MFTVQTLPGFDDPAAPEAPSIASINADGIAGIVDAALANIADQVLLSQGRWSTSCSTCSTSPLSRRSRS